MREDLAEQHELAAHKAGRLARGVRGEGPQGHGGDLAADRDVEETQEVEGDRVVLQGQRVLDDESGGGGDTDDPDPAPSGQAPHGPAGHEGAGGRDEGDERPAPNEADDDGEDDDPPEGLPALL